MKPSLLSRYERDNNGNVVIDVSTTRVEDLYNEFDKSTPFSRRDLDQDFAEYLIACARELDELPFVIRFTLGNPPDENRLSRIRGSLNSYFIYLAEGEIQEIVRMLRRSTLLFAFGLGTLFASVWITRLLGIDPTATTNVYAQEFTIAAWLMLWEALATFFTVAAWVALWEALATFLLGWFPHHKNVVLYRRLSHARLFFRSSADAERSHFEGNFAEAEVSYN